MNYTIVILGFVAEILIIYKYWFSLLNPRFTKGKSIVIYLTVALFNVVKSLIYFENMTFKGISTHVILFVAMCIIFRDGLLKKTVVYVLYLLCIFAAESVSLILAIYVYKCDLNNFMEPTLSNYLWSATTYIMIFIFTVTGLVFLKRKKINPDNLATQYIYLYSAIQLEILSMLYMLIIDYDVASPVIFALMTGIVLISFAIGILIYKTVQSAAQAKARAEFLKKESEIKNAHFDALQNQYVAYRRLRHDFYNHMRIIDEIDDVKKLKVYVSDIKKELIALESNSDI